jgi:hypothetical protein
MSARREPLEKRKIVTSRKLLSKHLLSLPALFGNQFW